MSKRSYILGRISNVQSKIDKYKSGLSYLDDATNQVQSMISSLEPCVNLINENFVINSKPGDDGLTDDCVNSLESLKSSISSIKSEINSAISELEQEKSSLYGQLAACKDDEE